MALLSISALLILLTVIIHHECLVAIKKILLTESIRPQRWVVGATVMALLLAHILEIALFAAGFHFLEHSLNAGQIMGYHAEDPTAALYLSFASYTTIGMGDLYPSGGLRLLSGIEGLVGLLMIGWSSSFLYLEMRSLWNGFENT